MISFEVIVTKDSLSPSRTVIMHLTSPHWDRSRQIDVFQKEWSEFVITYLFEMIKLKESIHVLDSKKKHSCPELTTLSVHLR